MKLILTRHGETLENRAGIMQGHLPGKLSDTGIDQAGKVAERLKDTPIDAIYSSDLARAADTAKEIARYHPDTPLEFVEALREKHLGEHQGKTRREVGIGDSFTKSKIEAPGSEPWEKVYERAEAFLHRTLEKHPDDTVVYVGHNGINKAIICAIIGKSIDERGTIENLGNTSISIFEIDEDKNHQIHLYNCTEHLD